MHTITLRSGDSVVPLAAVESTADLQAVVDHVASFAAITPTITAEPEVYVARHVVCEMLSRSGFTVVPGQADWLTGNQFDRIGVHSDGEGEVTFALVELRTSEAAKKAWDKRGRKGDDGSGAGGGDGDDPKPTRKVKVDAATAAAARAEVAAAYSAAGDDLDALRGVLSELDSEGPAATSSLHNRMGKDADRWTPEREALHDEIIDEILAEHADVPRDREAIFVGGLPGSGKSTALKSDALGFTTTYLHLDPDDIKQRLIDRGAVDMVPGLSPGEHAALIHEESSWITGEVRKAASADGINIIVDKTMNTYPDKDLTGLREDRYKVTGVFVDIDVDESLASADGRWRDGGRFIPPSYIESARADTGAKSKNADIFRQASTDFEEWIYVPNDGVSTIRGKTQEEQDAWNRDRDSKIVRGSGRATFAVRDVVVFRTYVRDAEGKFAPVNGAAIASGGADMVMTGDKVTVEANHAAAMIEELGNRTEPSDLTAVTIEGHPELFSTVARNGIPRKSMPQIPSDRLDDFGAYLLERGVDSWSEQVDPATLRATQNELDGRKVGQMVTALRTGTMLGDKPLWVSADNRILDGHHRWAAEAVLSLEAARQIEVVRVQLPMSQLLGQARQFAKREKIAAKAHGMTVVNAASFSSSEAARKAWETRRRNAETASTIPTVSPAGGLANGLPTAAEFDKMEKTGGPLGSQGGGWYRDDSGQKYLVKPAQSENHAHNELAAHLTYKHLGVPTDDTGIHERDGKWFIAKKAIQGPDGKLGDLVGDNTTPSIQSEARQGFGADALMSSWDAYGMVGDNVLTGSDGTLYRIDVGGSLQYRAQGGNKGSFNPGEPWTEPTTLRTSNQGRRLYGDMTGADAAAQLEKLRGLDVDALDAVYQQAGIRPQVRERTIATIRDRVEVQLPGIIDDLRTKQTFGLRPFDEVAYSVGTRDQSAAARKAWDTRGRKTGSGGIADDPEALERIRVARAVASSDYQAVTSQIREAVHSGQMTRHDAYTEYATAALDRANEVDTALRKELGWNSNLRVVDELPAGYTEVKRMVTPAELERYEAGQFILPADSASGGLATRGDIAIGRGLRVGPTPRQQPGRQEVTFGIWSDAIADVPAAEIQRPIAFDGAEIVVGDSGIVTGAGVTLTGASAAMARGVQAYRPLGSDTDVVVLDPSLLVYRRNR